jgi:hypothetical protein
MTGRIKRVYPLVLALLSAGTLGVILEARAADRAATDEDAVRSVVEAYFEGMMKASPETLGQAFHPSARLIGMGPNDMLRIIPFKEWADSWEGRDPLGPEGYVNKIVAIDIHGTAASVKTELTWPDVKYVDYLSLVNMADGWKIVNKIWDEAVP